MRIGQRSDSKSDAQQWVEGSNPLPSALNNSYAMFYVQPRAFPEVFHCLYVSKDNKLEAKTVVEGV